jgi:hypothetical protein
VLAIATAIAERDEGRNPAVDWLLWIAADIEENRDTWAIFWRGSKAREFEAMRRAYLERVQECAPHEETH